MTARRLPRRRLLQAAGAAVAGAALARGAAAQAVSDQDKIPQAEAKYQPQPHGQQRCEICLQFEPPNRCKIVRSPIAAKGWCQYFAARENAR